MTIEIILPFIGALLGGVIPAYYSYKLSIRNTKFEKLKASNEKLKIHLQNFMILEKHYIDALVNDKESFITVKKRIRKIAKLTNTLPSPTNFNLNIQ